MSTTFGHGVLLSAAAHGGLVFAIVLGFAAPRPFAEIPQEAVEVEVMTEREAAKQAEKQKQPTLPSPLTPPAEAKPELRPSQRMQAAAPATSPPPTPAPQAAPAPEKPPESAPPVQAEGQYSIFDPAALAQFYHLSPPPMGFDAPASQIAKLSGDEASAFRAQLRRCWRQPAGVPPSSRARVTIRVSFTPDGALAAEPTLIEATASLDGPLVYKAALQALSQCAPYKTLPPDRYREWRVLDISFTSQEMTGG